MAVDSTKVIVPGGATLYLGASGATLSTFNGTASPGTAWTDAGYLTEAGATFDLTRTTQDIFVWQSLDPVRKIQQSLTKAVAVVLREWSPTNLKYVLGGGTVTAGAGSVAGTAYGTYDFPSPSENPTVAVVLDTLDGSYATRFYFPAMVCSDNVQIPVSRNDSMTLPLSLTSLASATAPKIYSNGPGWTV
jgi:hypothetical protein